MRRNEKEKNVVYGLRYTGGDSWIGPGVSGVPIIQGGEAIGCSTAAGLVEILACAERGERIVVDSGAVVVLACADVEFSQSCVCSLSVVANDEGV